MLWVRGQGVLKAYVGLVHHLFAGLPAWVTFSQGLRGLQQNEVSHHARWLPCRLPSSEIFYRVNNESFLSDGTKRLVILLEVVLLASSWEDWSGIANDLELLELALLCDRNKSPVVESTFPQYFFLGFDAR